MWSGSPLRLTVAQEGSKLGGVGVFKEQHQKALVEFKGAGKLAEDLPHAVQEEQEDWSLLARFDVGVGRLGAALLEWVSRLWLIREQNKPKRLWDKIRMRGLTVILHQWHCHHEFNNKTICYLKCKKITCIFMYDNTSQYSIKTA